MTLTPFFIGLDVGTTSVKAVAFDDVGFQICARSTGYLTQRPQEDWAEQDPEQIVAATLQALLEVYSACKDAGPLTGVSFSAAMHTLIAVDEYGAAISPCIIWADNRASEIARELRETRQDLFHLTGTPLHAMSPLSKLIWMRRFQPDVFNRAARFVGIKEYILFRFFGVWACDHSTASATGLMNICSLQWEPAALQLAGLTPDRLPGLVAPQHIFYWGENGFPVNKEEKKILPEGTPVIIGASDGCLANLGSDATRAGDLTLTIGTSGAVRAFIPEIHTDPEMRTFCYLLDAARPVAGGGANAGGFILQWLKEQLLQSPLSYTDFYASAGLATAGSDGLLMAPYLLGERSPLWDENIRGAFVGIGARHGTAHFIRAAMEGVVYHLYSIARVLNERTPVRRILAGGGFAQSPLWLQIAADVFQIPVVVGDSVGASARGAVMMGREALRMAPFPPMTETAVFEPNPANKTVYEDQMRRFEKMQAFLKTME